MHHLFELNLFVTFGITNALTNRLMYGTLVQTIETLQ